MTTQIKQHFLSTTSLTEDELENSKLTTARMYRVAVKAMNAFENGEHTLESLKAETKKFDDQYHPARNGIEFVIGVLEGTIKLQTNEVEETEAVEGDVTDTDVEEIDESGYELTDEQIAEMDAQFEDLEIEHEVAQMEQDKYIAKMQAVEEAAIIEKTSADFFQIIKEAGYQIASGYDNMETINATGEYFWILNIDQRSSGTPSMAHWEDGVRETLKRVNAVQRATIESAIDWNLEEDHGLGSAWFDIEKWLNVSALLQIAAIEAIKTR